MRALASFPVSDTVALATADALGLPAIGRASRIALCAPDREFICGEHGELVGERHGFQTGDGPLEIDGELRWWISLGPDTGKVATSVAAALSGKATPVGWGPTGALIVRTTVDAERLYYPLAPLAFDITFADRE